MELAQDCTPYTRLEVFVGVEQVVFQLFERYSGSARDAQKDVVGREVSDWANGGYIALLQIQSSQLLGRHMISLHNLVRSKIWTVFRKQDLDRFPQASIILTWAAFFALKDMAIDSFVWLIQPGSIWMVGKVGRDVKNRPGGLTTAGTYHFVFRCNNTIMLRLNHRAYRR